MKKEDNENFNVLGANIILDTVNKTIGDVKTLPRYSHSNFRMKQSPKGYYVKRDEYLNNLSMMQLGLTELYGANNRMIKTIEHQDNKLTEYQNTVTEQEKNIIKYGNKELTYQRQISKQSDIIDNAAPAYSELKERQHITLVIASVFFWSTVGLSIYALIN